MHILSDLVQFLVSLLHVGQCLESTLLQLSDRANLERAQFVLGWILLNSAAPFVEVDRRSIDLMRYMFSQELFPLFVEPAVHLIVEDRSEPVVGACGVKNPSVGGNQLADST